MCPNGRDPVALADGAGTHNLPVGNSFPFESGSLLDSALTGCCCLALLLLTTWMHYEALRVIRVVHPLGTTTGRARTMLMLLGIATAHVTEVLVYATAYYLLARHAHAGTLSGAAAPSLKASLYFSLETYSSLGYGDIVPSGALRGMAGAEALNGLLLIGWSACYVHGALDAFPNRSDGEPSTATPPPERRCTRRRAP
jgi:hypothetical protein